MSKLTIGKVASAAGISVETVRFYERLGLIKKPTNRVGSFRIYTPETLDTLHFIRKAQDLGFTLKEVKDLLMLDQSNRSSCSDVAELAQQKIAEIKKKMAELKRIEKALKKLVVKCEKTPKEKAYGKVSECFK